MSKKEFKKYAREEFKQRVRQFQENLADELVKQFKKDPANKLVGQFKNAPGGYIEVPLYQPAGDRADILIPLQGYTVITEIDATRADQVAKKMISRFCWPILQKKKIVYVSLLYPGTDVMNQQECKKYFGMGAKVLTKLNSKNIFIGYIIGQEPTYDYCYCSGLQGCGYTKPVSCNRCASQLAVAQIIMDEFAKDAYNYRIFLKKNGINSENSIACYMRPLNIVHSISTEISTGIKDLRKELANLSKRNEVTAEYLCITLKLQPGTNLGKITYWNRYCEYCKEILNSQTL